MIDVLNPTEKLLDSFHELLQHVQVQGIGRSPKA